MSTRGWKEFRRRRTFPVTRSFITKRRFFGKFDPLVETFLECETTCREPPLGHVFVESMAEIDRRKVVEDKWCVVHVTKTTGPIFSRSVRNPWRDLAGNVQGLVFSVLNALTPPVKCHPNPSKFPRFISENVTIYRDVARHGLGGAQAPPPKFLVSPPNRVQPIVQYGLHQIKLRSLCVSPFFAVIPRKKFQNPIAWQACSLNVASEC